MFKYWNTIPRIHRDIVGSPLEIVKNECTAYLNCAYPTKDDFVTVPWGLGTTY